MEKEVLGSIVQNKANNMERFRGVVMGKAQICLLNTLVILLLLVLRVHTPGGERERERERKV